MSWLRDTWDSATDALSNLWDSTMDILKDVVEFGFKVLGIEDEIVYLVNVHTTRLVPDATESITKKLILNNALGGQSIADHHQTQNLTGALANVNRFYNYGRNHYIHELPTSTIWNNNDQVVAIDDVLTTIAGVPVTITFTETGSLSALTWIKWYLQENDGYIYNTNSLTVGSHVYKYTTFTVDGLGDYIIEMAVDEVQRIEVWIKTTRTTIGSVQTTVTQGHTKTFVDNTGILLSDSYDASSVSIDAPPAGIPDGITDEKITVKYATVHLTYDIGHTVPQLNSTLPWFHVIYNLDSTPDVSLLWVYDRSSGVHPSLDALPIGGVDTTQMLPIIPLRRDFIDVNSDTGTAEYQTSKKILNIIGLDLDAYTEMYTGNEYIDKIEDVAIMFATNIYSQTPGCMHVFHNLFSGLADSLDITKEEYQSYPDGSNSPVNVYTIKEQRINTVIQYNWITKNIIAGSVLPVNTYSSVHTILPNSTLHPAEQIDPDDSMQGSIPTWGNEPRSLWTLRHQIDASSYEEIVIEGITLITAIYTVATHAKAVVIIQQEPGHVDNASADIPLSFEMVRGLTLDEETEALYESLVMKMYSKEVVHLRYYETAGFANLVSFVLKVVAIIILIVTFGNAKDLSTFLWAFGEQMLYNYALTQALAVILTHNLSDAARLIVLAAFAYASYKLAANSVTDIMPTADKLLLAVNSVTQVTSVDLMVQSDQLKDDMAEFNALAQSRQEELDAAYDNLNPENGLTAMDVIRTYSVDASESVENFYERTIHTTNPGILVFDGLHNYVENALTLPNPQLV